MLSVFKGEPLLTEALHPRYTPGGNLYFDESGQYDQSEYWRVVAQTRDVIDQQVKQEAKEYADEKAGELHDKISAVENAAALKTLGSTHLDEVTERGSYIQLFSSNVTPANGYPKMDTNVGLSGTLHVEANSGVIYQRYYMGTGAAWMRYRSASGTWNAWVQLGAQPETLTALGDNHLDSVTQRGSYMQLFSSRATPENGYPAIESVTGRSGVLEVDPSSGVIYQRYYTGLGSAWLRYRTPANEWVDWVPMGVDADLITRQIEAGDAQTLAEAKAYADASGGGLLTDMEITGRWTPTEQGDAFLQGLGNHEAVDVLELGRSVEDRPIYAAVIGDPTKPAVMVVAGQHGTEVGTSEAAWLWVREIRQSSSLILMDLCIIVVPCMNPDNRFNARGNRNGVDLNRDWDELAQPETQAVAALFDQYNILAVLDAHNFGYPREVSMQGATRGPQPIQDASTGLFNAVMAALEVDGQLARYYAPAGPAGTLVNGASENFSAASLLVEIPCGGYGDWTFDHYEPAPSWQAHVGMVSFNAFAHHVWKNLETFEALKNGMEA